VVVVTWNSRPLVGPCLRSLLASPLPADTRVIVIDNDSADGTAEAVAAEFPGVQLVRNHANVGFARAANQGLALAESRYVLLLNPDTTMPRPDTLPRWLAFMDAHPDVAASGCRLISPDGRHQVGDAGFRPSPGSVLAYAFFLSRLAPRRMPSLFLAYRRLAGPTDVDWICGADLLLRRAALERIGPLLENGFMYAEDVEWGCRARARGYRVVYLADLAVVHVGGASTAQRQQERGFSLLWLANLRQLYGQSSSRAAARACDTMLCAGFGLRAMIYALLAVVRRDRTRWRAARRLWSYADFCRKPLEGRR
jgi:GT2 family glycosyltransferase